MKLKCKKCGNPLSLEDVYDSDGGLDEGYIIEKRLYCCDKCETDYTVGINVPVPEPQEDNIIWFQESWYSLVYIMCAGPLTHAASRDTG